MALVIKTDMVDEHLSTKMAITGGVTSNIAIDGVTHMDIITYPAQDNFKDGAIIALIQKPFIDFAASCGGAGEMTSEKIIEKYGDKISTALVDTIVADFAKAYGNYVIIPDVMTLIITAAPINSIFDLMIKEDEPVEENAE